MGTLGKLVGVVVLVGGAFLAGWLASATGAGQEVAVADLDARERAFVERMHNVVLVGHFTVEGQEQQDRLPERYEIKSVTKLDGNRWRFNARVKYMSVDVTLPVVVPIEWAGDTPMVSITDFALPGLGEGFGSRVLFYDERYAGTWDHNEVGGLMYGTIEPLVPGESPVESSP